MFRSTLKTLAVNPYVRFLMESRKSIKGVGGLRAYATTKAYRALTETEMNALKKRAAATVLKPKKAAPRKFNKTPSAYAKFLKANFKAAKGSTPQQKFTSVANLWRQQKGSS